MKTVKHCNACNSDLSITEFSKCAACRDGVQPKCRKCRAAAQRHHYHKRKTLVSPEQLREEWRTARERRRVAALEATKASYRKNRQHYAQKVVDYRRQHPDVKAAHIAVQRAVESGLLPPQSAHRCANHGCKQMANEYHHWSYSPQHRTSVIPLCFSCHRLLHKGEIVLSNPESYTLAPTDSKDVED